jgi:peroxiredoxin family protein
MRPDPLHLPVLVLSGEFGRVHYALVYASTSLALASQVTLMFAADAVHALTMRSGRPGWHRLRGPDGRSAEATDADWRARGIAGFEELLASCASLGARILACEMALAASRLRHDELRGDLAISVAGIATLIADAGAAPIVF